MGKVKANWLLYLDSELLPGFQIPSSLTDPSFVLNTNLRQVLDKHPLPFAIRPLGGLHRTVSSPEVRLVNASWEIPSALDHRMASGIPDAESRIPRACSLPSSAFPRPLRRFQKLTTSSAEVVTAYCASSVMKTDGELPHPPTEHARDPFSVSQTLSWPSVEVEATCLPSLVIQTALTPAACACITRDIGPRAALGCY